jgi:hypothetical protein
MPKLQDLTGRVFGRLTVIHRAENDPSGNPQWLCECSCSARTQKAIPGSTLRAGTSQSCGCLAQESHRARMLGNKRAFKHGHNPKSGESPTYQTWSATIERCTYPKHAKWKHYGGANPPITICERWLCEHGFEHFLSDMGERPANTTLGRFGDVGNYSCGHCDQCKQNGWELNCEWQTWKQQAREQRKKRLLAVLD